PNSSPRSAQRRRPSCASVPDDRTRRIGGAPVTTLRFALEAAVNDPAGPRAIPTIGPTAPRRWRRRPIRRRHSHPATVAAAPPRLLTMERLRQPVATHGNGFRLFEPLSRAFHLRPIATGCNHGAPQRLHPRVARDGPLP